MARTATFPLIDRLVGGDLQAQLIERRGSGESYATIARWLLIDHDIVVGIDTVRRWCADIGVEAAS